MNTYSNASNQYLAQRVLGANPGQMVVILLEGAQRFVNQAGQAIARKDYEAKARAIRNATAILQELTRWLDRERGGQLAENLLALYLWWGRELLEAGFKLDATRTERVSEQMADIRRTWELSFRQRAGAQPRPGFQTGELVG
jgi:flagellar protein FliS